MYGVIRPLTAKELNQVPEGDRVQGMMAIHAPTEIFITRAGEDQGTSDKLYWNDHYYRLSNVKPYSDFGYWTANAVRIEGN